MWDKLRDLPTIHQKGARTFQPTSSQKRALRIKKIEKMEEKGKVDIEETKEKLERAHKRLKKLAEMKKVTF